MKKTKTSKELKESMFKMLEEMVALDKECKDCFGFSGVELWTAKDAAKSAHRALTDDIYKNAYNLTKRLYKDKPYLIEKHLEAFKETE